MSFSSLPTEIQIELFSYLDDYDIKAIRAVCRTFKDNTYDISFRTALITVRYQSLGAFQNIASSPLLQENVTRIIFDGSLYDETFAKDEQSYHTQAAKFPDLAKGYYWDRQSRWKRYAQLFREQEELKSSGVLLHTISRAVESMPNLSSIVYSPRPRHLPKEVKQLDDLLPAGVTTSAAGAYTFLDHTFRQLINALYQSRFTGIREFRTEAYSANSGTQFALGLFDRGRTYVHDNNKTAPMRFFFQHLTTLVLNMSFWVLEDPPVPFVRAGEAHERAMGEFLHLLEAATNVEHFHLRITHYMLDYNKHLSLRMNWPKLQSLIFEQVDLGGEELNIMIKRHKHSLRSLQFRKCSLVRVYWADVVEDVVYQSPISTFVLDCVHDTGVCIITDLEVLYTGHLKVMDDGERIFIEEEPVTKSMFDARREVQQMIADYFATHP